MRFIVKIPTSDRLVISALIVFTVWFFFLRTDPFYMVLGFWDMPITVSGANRFFEGILPHRDYPSVLGPISYLIPFVGMIFLGKTFAGYNLGLLLFALTLMLCMYFIQRIRGQNAVVAVLPAIFAGSYLFCPRTFHYEISHLGLLGIYNVEGHIMLAVLVCDGVSSICLRRTSKYENAVGFISGTVFISLFFLKTSFAAVGSVMTLLLLVANWKKRSWYSGFFIAAVATALICLMAIGFDVVNMVRDWLTPIVSRPELSTNIPLSVWEIPSVYTRVGFANPQVAALLGASGCFVAAVILSSKKSLKAAIFKLIALLCLVVVVMGAESVIAMSITQPHEFFQSGHCGLLLLCMLANEMQARRLSAILIPLSVVVVGWNLTYKNWLSLVQLQRLKNGAVTANPENRNYLPKFEYFKDAFASQPSAGSFTDFETEEILCRGLKSKVVLPGYPDFISPALGLPIAKGAPLYWHYGVTFSNAALKIFPNRLGENEIFREVDTVVIAKKKVVLIRFKNLRIFTKLIFWRIFI